MGGLVGWIGVGQRPARLVLTRLLLSPAALGKRVRRAASAPVAIFGERDADMAEGAERGEFMAISGYVRLRGRASTAREVLDAWRTHREGLLPSLGGEFSLAASTAGRVLVARDALGTRPMYVADLPQGGVAFSTSMFALLCAGARSELDYDAVTRSLILGYSTAPATALLGIRQLGPGEFWELSPRREICRWFLLRERLDRQRSMNDATRLVDRTVTTAVRDALPSEGNVAAFLSGGIDSSIVLARLKEAGASVDAFTLFFGDTVPGEIRYARAVARHLRVRHHVLEVSAEQFCDGIETAVLHLEDLVSEAIAIPNLLLARAASRTAKVLFTGEGGDQSFGGPKNVGMALAYAYCRHPASPPLAQTYLSLHHYLWSDFHDALSPHVLAAFHSEKLAKEVGAHLFHDGRRPSDRSFVGGVMIGNTVLKGGSNILIKVAKVIDAANDVALRSPMFNPVLVQLAFTIPPWQKMDGTDEKLVLRRAAVRSLPEWVVNRPKRGMTLPLGAWFEGKLGVLARDLLSERAVRERGIMRWSYIDRLFARAHASHGPRGDRTHDKLWLALMNELHFRALDRIIRQRTSQEKTMQEMEHA